MGRKMQEGPTQGASKRRRFYQRGWFLGSVVILGVLGGVMTLGGNSDEEAAKKVPTKVNQASAKPAKIPAKPQTTTFKVGDVIKYQGVEFKVNHVSFLSGNEYEHPDQGKEYVVVNLTITNQAQTKYDYNPFDYKLDERGNQTDLNSIYTEVDTLNAGTLAQGGTVTGNLLGQVTKGAPLKLLYNGSILDNQEHFTVNLR